MFTSVRSLKRQILGAAAGGLLVALAMPLLAQSGRTIGWSPSRDEAVIVDENSAIGSGVRQAADYVEEIGPITGRRLPVRRPARLLPRSSVGRMHEGVTQEPIAVEQLPVPGEVLGGPMIAGDCDSCGGNDCGQCVDCCGNWNSCGPVPLCALLPRPRWENLELHAGVHGFTGPLNRGASGSFGFHEGFNYALPICYGDWGCGQIGALWTQSNYDGSFLESDERNQIFVTGGFFRRVDWGLQCGVVFDYLHDEWDYEIDLGQVRGELGWKYCGCNEIGFRFTAGVNDDTASFNDLTLDDNELTIGQRTAGVEVNDLYAFYFRRQFACGGEGRLFGGCTGNQQGLVGGDVRLPMNARWSLAADFLYVVPSEDSTLPGFIEETWNLSIGLVWTPCAKPDCGPNYCRPLFDVANNGTFATRVR
jgi:hypothetical protein